MVEIGGISNHLPIILEVSKASLKMSLPMKFNHDWLKEEDYQKMVEETWCPMSEDVSQSSMKQFSENIGKIRKATISWANDFKKKQKAAIVEVESKLSYLLIEREARTLSEMEETLIKELMIKKQELYRIKESNWRQKGRVVWIQEGDNNTKYFHIFASFRRETNSIWEIKDDQGKKVTSFEEIADEGKNHFSNLFKEPVGCPIAKILKVINLFPSFISDEMNFSLQEEISKKEIF
jgi:hypothetical protein